MTNQYMNNLYRDLLSNSPQTITIDIPADMGTGQILQVVTKQGAVVSDWKMNYFSDMNVQGVSSEEYIQMLFCFNDGVSWNIADSRQSISIQKGESCIYRGHGKMEYLCYSKQNDFLFKNVKVPLSYFRKIMNDYFDVGEIEVYQKKLLEGISKVGITPYMEHIFAELKDVKIRVCGMEAQVLRVGDLDWNREAVQNILKNAIEHSKKGETVTVTLSDNAVYTSVSIANPGAPITKEKIKKIFERYYSAANDGSSNIGIGLPLAKAILEKQNAYLSVESENGYNVFIIKYLK